MGAPAAVEAEGGVLRGQVGEGETFERADAVVIEEQGAGLREEPDDSERKENIADARGDKGFFRGGRGGGF